LTPTAAGSRIAAVANPDRLDALDASLLELEERGLAHMHVASAMTFRGRPPSIEQLIDHVGARLHLVPRYRQRLATVPLGQGRPVWTDDPYFNPSYHIRSIGLPRPGDEAQLKRLTGQLVSQTLDHSKPLWGLWLVERMADDRFALLAKTHQALVDTRSGVDITTVLFDPSPEPAPIPPPTEPWDARPLPGPAKLLGEALLERAIGPRRLAHGVQAALRAPGQLVAQVGGLLAELGTSNWVSGRAAPPSPLNREIGQHRRYSWVDAKVATFETIRAALGGTTGDAVLTVVALALGRHLRAQGYPTTGLVLRALVPVSTREHARHDHAPDGRVAAMWAPLPVGVEDPVRCHAEISAATAQPDGTREPAHTQTLTDLAGFAPPTILSRAARLQARQRAFNLAVTYAPGPQFPLYLLGRRMLRLYPVIPLARRQALGVAVVSYDGALGFGLLGDYDALPELDSLAAELEGAIAALARAAAAKRRMRSRPRDVGARSRAGGGARA
jgi:WS/DGAT/MGAT family acyltransferase